MKNKDADVVLEVLMAGARQSGEQSRALPQRAYGDPANIVEFESERRRKAEKRKRRQKQRGE